MFLGVAPLHYSVRRLLFIAAVSVLAAAPWAVFSADRAAPAGVLSKVSAYPNPFDSRRGKTKIAYTLSSDRRVTVDIYSIYGVRIWNKSIPPAALGGRRGTNLLVWDGTDRGGRKVAKGLYFALVRVGADHAIIKIGVIH